MTAASVAGPTRQRFGRIVERRAHGSGPYGVTGRFFVRDDDTGETFGFDYTDIVTEGFRTLDLGERIRFVGDAGRARYVIRVDLPEVDEFYR